MCIITKEFPFYEETFVGNLCGLGILFDLHILLSSVNNEQLHIISFVHKHAWPRNKTVQQK